MKTVGATVLGGLWALEWAPQSTETNLRCVRSSGICWQSTETNALRKKLRNLYAKSQ